MENIVKSLLKEISKDSKNTMGVESQSYTIGYLQSILEDLCYEHEIVKEHINRCIESIKKRSEKSSL